MTWIKSLKSGRWGNVCINLSISKYAFSYLNNGVKYEPDLFEVEFMEYALNYIFWSKSDFYGYYLEFHELLHIIL